MVVFFEEGFGAGLVTNDIEGSTSRIFGCGGIVGGDVFITFGFEFLLFGAGEANGFGSIKNKDGGIFADARII